MLWLLWVDAGGVSTVGIINTSSVASDRSWTPPTSAHGEGSSLESIEAGCHVVADVDGRDFVVV